MKSVFVQNLFLMAFASSALANPILSTRGAGGAHMTPQGLEMLKTLEGFVAHQYPDQQGVATQGYGRNCTVHKCKDGDVTKEEASKWLEEDLQVAETAVCGLPGASDLSDTQFDGLVSYFYNQGNQQGEKDFGEDIKAKKLDEIGEKLGKTGLRGGVSGLAERRQKEAERFKTKSDKKCGC